MTDERGGDPTPALSEAREAVVSSLMEHFAQDRLTMREFEERIDRAHRARSADDLEVLLRDLPGGAGAIVGADEAPARSAARRRRPQVPGERVKEHSTMVACMGGTSRKGRWIPARRTHAFALWGGIELDFREALLGPGVTEVNLFCLMGGADIVVPPDLYVESTGVALMGSFENAEEHPSESDPDAPVLRVRGMALMGGVTVSTRYPGESRKEARIRRKEERRARRRRLEDG